VHRIGRTGRAGEEGAAVSLVSSDELKQLRGIQRLLEKRDPVAFDAGVCAQSVFGGAQATIRTSSQDSVAKAEARQTRQETFVKRAPFVQSCAR